MKERRIASGVASRDDTVQLTQAAAAAAAAAASAAAVGSSSWGYRPRMKALALRQAALASCVVGLFFSSSLSLSLSLPYSGVVV